MARNKSNKMQIPEWTLGFGNNSFQFLLGRPDSIFMVLLVQFSPCCLLVLSTYLYINCSMELTLYFAETLEPLLWACE